MTAASFSLSPPRAGWNSTSMPRSRKICTAAGERASEMRTFGADMGAFFLHAPVGEGRCRQAAGSAEAKFAQGVGGSTWAGVSHPTPDLRSDPPPPGEGGAAGPWEGVLFTLPWRGRVDAKRL